MFENTALKKIAGPKWEDVSGEWTEQRNEDLHDPYSFRNFVKANKTRRMRWVKAREIHGKGLFGKHEGTRPVVRPWNRWKNKTKFLFHSYYALSPYVY